MNLNDAKRILIAYRPGSNDDRDPEVAQALELMRTERGLQVWLEEQAAFHRTMRAALRSIPIPADLKERILAQRKIIAPFWRRPETLVLAAACLALALVVSALWVKRPGEDRSFAGFRARMVGFALREYRMDILTNDLVQIQEYLRREARPWELNLTPGLQATPLMGAASLSWQGQPVSMVCFSLPRKEILYMFVLDQTALRTGRIPDPQPHLEPIRGIMTASWSADGKVYLIAANTDESTLREKAARLN